MRTEMHIPNTIINIPTKAELEQEILRTINLETIKEIEEQLTTIQTNEDWFAEPTHAEEAVKKIKKLLQKDKLRQILETEWKTYYNVYHIELDEITLNKKENKLTLGSGNTYLDINLNTNHRDKIKELIRSTGPHTTPKPKRYLQI